MFQVTANEMHGLVSNQEETDTRTVLYLKYAAKLGYKLAVVRTPDTDMFFIQLHHAQSIALTVFLDIGTGKHLQLVNVSKAAESLEVNYCNMLLGLYAFTGEDATSAFKGKGNIGQLKKLQTIPKYHAAFQWVSFIVCELIVYTYCKRDSLYFCWQLGDDWSVKSEVINNFEQFTCAMYGHAKKHLWTRCER